MKKILFASAVVLFTAVTAVADTFGTGANQFEIDFVNISYSRNPARYYPVTYDYRIGSYEITNNIWNRFKAAYGPVTGSPSTAYDNSSYFTGASIPTNKVSWFEAAQFINWLNLCKGYQPAYKFTGMQGTNDYSFAVWDISDAGYNSSNPYRNGNAYYFLPSESEWVTAAYWDGTIFQTYATKAGESISQSNGTSGTGWNYYPVGSHYIPDSPWSVGSGSQELNGTYDMMGNVWEWTESPYHSGPYSSNVLRTVRGGSFSAYEHQLSSPSWIHQYPDSELYNMGFRVASVPEPGTVGLLAIGAVLLRKRAKGKR